MDFCSNLKKIQSDLEVLSRQTVYVKSCEYDFGNDLFLNYSVHKARNNSYILNMTGPTGDQEADLENFERLFEILTLFISQQIIEIANRENFVPCTDAYHGPSEEILAILAALRAFEENPEIPFFYKFQGFHRRYEILSITESDDGFRISMSPKYKYTPHENRITVVKSQSQILERAIQLTAVEIINRLTPEKTRSKVKSGLFANLSTWLLPAIAAGVIALGGLATWFYFNGNDSWQTLEKKANQEFSEGRSDKAIELYHRAIIKAERDGVSDEIKLEIYKRLVDKVRTNGPYDSYLKEAAKLIVVSELLGSPTIAEDTIFRVAQDEFVHENYSKALVQLQSVIPMIEKSRGKNFFGLIRAYELLGKCYFELHDFKSAENAFLRSLAVSEKTKRPSLESSAGFSNYYLGILSKEKKEYAQARKYLIKACEQENKLINSKTKYTTIDKRFLELNPRKALEEIEMELKIKN